MAEGEDAETDTEEVQVMNLPNHIEVVLQVDNDEWSYYIVDLERCYDSTCFPSFSLRCC